MKIETVETTVLEMPYTKPLITATNHFTVARGLLVKVVTDGGDRGLWLFGSFSDAPVRRRRPRATSSTRCSSRKSMGVN